MLCIAHYSILQPSVLAGGASRLATQALRSLASWLTPALPLLGCCRKERKEQTREHKSKIKKNYTTIHESVQLWEKLRQKTTSAQVSVWLLTAPKHIPNARAHTTYPMRAHAEHASSHPPSPRLPLSICLQEKQQLASMVTKKVVGKVPELANHHSASRVIQFVMKDAKEEDKKVRGAPMHRMCSCVHRGRAGGGSGLRLHGVTSGLTHAVGDPCSNSPALYDVRASPPTSGRVDRPPALSLTPPTAACVARCGGLSNKLVAAPAPHSDPPPLPARVQVLMTEVRANIVVLSKSKYGRHLVQKLITVASKEEVPGDRA